MIRIVVLEDEEQIAAGDYPRDIVLVGSKEDADLRVQSAEVQPNHAEIWMLGGRCYARPLGEHSLLINGELVAARAEIGSGSEINLGDVKLQVLVDPEGNAPMIPTTTRRRSRTAVMMRLNSGIIDFSQADESQEVMEEARKLLVEARASPLAFEDLKTGGVEHARKLIRAHKNRQLARELLGYESQSGKTAVQGKPPAHPALVALLGALAAGLIGFAVYRLWDMLQSFQ